MVVQRIVIIAVLAALIGVPLLLRPEPPGGVTGSPGSPGSQGESARRLIVITPHNEQIRSEFGRAFAQWHEQHYGEAAQVIWSVPGGTSEIRRMLQAQYRADVRDGRPPGGGADVLFGGGSYEFNELRRPIDEAVRSGPRAGTVEQTTVLAPLALDAEFIAEVYGGRDRIGDEPLYDHERHWFGAALSGFGIVYNRDVLRRLGVDEPQHWSDLTAPQLIGWIALVNPSQSGSITTAYEAILLRRGWDEGWRILRRAAANARTFSASSTRAPIDVSLGDAAAGISIDFYGRYQSQAIREGGGGDRVGYIDPPGETQIDADPIAMLRGAPDPELAERFVRFVLSREGQALWQFPAPTAADGLGPAHHELRRMPVRRELYESDDFSRFIDRVDPERIASSVADADRNMRSFIAPIFSAMAIDVHHGLRSAWIAIVEHPAYPTQPSAGGAAIVTGEIVTADDVDDPQLKAMLAAFDAMPAIPGPDGTFVMLDTTTGRAAARDGWLRGQWKEHLLWPAESSATETLRRRFTRFFDAQYGEVVAIARDQQGRTP